MKKRIFKIAAKKSAIANKMAAVVMRQPLLFIGYFFVLQYV